MVNLSTKEQYLLKDQKSHEELCVKKYTSYANAAKDSELKEMFSAHANHEQQHLNTINQILGGQVPQMNQQQSQGQQSQKMQFTQGQPQSQNDIDMCTDMLQTEKYVSSTYDVAIFEFADSNIRQTLNHIQKEEQQHGEDIFNYLKAKGAYSVQ